MNSRRKSRKLALQIQSEDIQNHLSYFNTEPALQDFAHKLITTSLDHQQETDEKLEKTSTNWALDRMSYVDRAILRLAISEVAYLETPPAAAMNEAIELAKEFGDDKSAQFINGVLDKVLKE
jgi:N utilization substance protein B